MDVFDWRKRLLGLPYPDAEKSVGMFYRKMGLENCWEVVGPARAEFEQIAKEIKDFLEKNFEPTSTPVLWTMYMIGRSENTARPTILFCSKEADCRKAVRKFIEKSGILKKFPAVRVGDANRPPDFDRLVLLALCEECALVPNSQSITPVPSITSYQLPTLHPSNRSFRILEILPEKKRNDDSMPFTDHFDR